MFLFARKMQEPWKRRARPRQPQRVLSFSLPHSVPRSRTCSHPSEYRPRTHPGCPAWQLEPLCQGFGWRWDQTRMWGIPGGCGRAIAQRQARGAQHAHPAAAGAKAASRRRWERGRKEGRRAPEIKIKANLFFYLYALKYFVKPGAMAGLGPWMPQEVFRRLRPPGPRGAGRAGCLPEQRLGCFSSPLLPALLLQLSSPG